MSVPPTCKIHSPMILKTFGYIASLTQAEMLYFLVVAQIAHGAMPV